MPHLRVISPTSAPAVVVWAAVFIASAGALFRPAPVDPRGETREFAFTAPDSVFQVGEELTYNVSYASFDIGQVRITLLGKEVRNGVTYYKAMAHIDSYKGVPFVDLHAIYEDSIHQRMYSTWFLSRHKEEKGWDYFLYTYDYPRRMMYIEHGEWGKMHVLKKDTLEIDTTDQDGLSLFYLARVNLFSKQKMNIPTVVNEKRGMTTINFSGERTHEEIDAVKYPVDLIHFEGEAGFVGIFGLTGAFEGWFSNDAARVPVIAKMKVLIGNIRIELMKWRRTNWHPPRYREDSPK